MRTDGRRSLTAFFFNGPCVPPCCDFSESRVNRRGKLTPDRRAKKGSDAVLMMGDHVAPISRALEKVKFAATIHLTFDHWKTMAARTAAMSLATPFANDASRLVRALVIHRSRSALDFRRIMAWKPLMICRASTREDTPRRRNPGTRVEARPPGAATSFLPSPPRPLACADRSNTVEPFLLASSPEGILNPISALLGIPCRCSLFSSRTHNRPSLDFCDRCSGCPRTAYRRRLKGGNADLRPSDGGAAGRRPTRAAELANGAS